MEAKQEKQKAQDNRKKVNCVVKSYVNKTLATQEENDDEAEVEPKKKSWGATMV